MNKNLKVTLMWVALSVLFCIGIGVFMGQDKAFEFMTAYLSEYSLSTDNLFVFGLVFAAFGMEGDNQRKILKWGIIGAFIFRAIFIFAGSWIISMWHPVLYIFGAFLVWTAAKMIWSNMKENDDEPEVNPAVIRAVNKLGLNPFMGCLLAIELSDIVFAVDSIPATFAVTQDPFIVYTANLFAIMGLRPLYFVLEDMKHKFENIKYGIPLILAFIGSKILLDHWIEIPTWIALSLSFVTLVICVLTSKKKPEEKAVV